MMIESNSGIETDYSDMLSLNTDLYNLLTKDKNSALSRIDADASYKFIVEDVFRTKSRYKVPHIHYTIIDKDNPEVINDTYKELNELIENEFGTMAVTRHNNDKFAFIEGYIKKYPGIVFKLACYPVYDSVELTFQYK